MKHSYFLILLVITLFSFSSCKKDKITVDEEKTFAQVDPKPVSGSPYDGPFRLTLKPDGVADILPGGDIVYRGTYKINGASLKVKTDNESFDFEIISETDIKSKKYEVVLRWENIKP